MAEESISQSEGSGMQELDRASNVHLNPEAAQVYLSNSHSYDPQVDKLVGLQPICAGSEEPIFGGGADVHSVLMLDDSSNGFTRVNGNELPFLENAKEDWSIVPFLENAKEDGNVIPYLENDKEDVHVTPSKVCLANEKTDEGLPEDDAGPEKEAGGLDGTPQGSSPLRTDPDIYTESDSIKAVWDSEAPLSHTGTEAVEDLDKQQRMEEGSGLTPVITMDVGGWQRFDAEESNTDVDNGYGITRQSTDLWEQLLDDGLEGHIVDDHISLLQIVSASSPHGEDQYGLPSPGNPFVEGPERTSSFSEVEGSIFHGGLHSSHCLLQSFEQQPTIRDMKESYHDVGGIQELSSAGMSGTQPTFVVGPERTSSFPEVEGSISHGAAHSFHGLVHSSEEQPMSPEMQESHHDVNGIEESSSSIPGVSQPTAISVGEDAKQPETITGTRHPSQASFSQIRSASFDAMEPFEAPSFMSLVDPKTSALFAAFMPTYQASSTVQGQENVGEKWVANFELMAPPAQEISRSMSLPRAEASPGPPIGRGEGHSFSFATKKVQEPKKEIGLPAELRPGASPKLSPLVQKVVDKVRTTHVVALNTVRQVMAPKVTGDDKGTTSKGSWLCRICC